MEGASDGRNRENGKTGRNAERSKTSVEGARRNVEHDDGNGKERWEVRDERRNGKRVSIQKDKHILYRPCIQIFSLKPQEVR